MHKTLQAKPGFTLLELVVTIVLLGILGIGLIAVVSTATMGYVEAQTNAQFAQRVEYAVLRLKLDMNDAVHVGGNYVVGSECAVSGDDRLGLLDLNGTPRQLFFDTADNTLKYSYRPPEHASSVTGILLENVDIGNSEFSYFDIDGNALPALPTGCGSGTVSRTDLAVVQLDIRMSIPGSSRSSDFSFTFAPNNPR